MKKLLSLLFILIPILPVSPQTIDVKGPGVPLPHYWSVGTCAGRVNEGLRTAWVEQLQTVHDE